MTRETTFHAIGREWSVSWVTELVDHPRWYAVTTCIVSTADIGPYNQIVLMGLARCAHGDAFNHSCGMELSLQRAIRDLQEREELLKAATVSMWLRWQA